MKKTETFVVLRSKETGQFLVEYKNNGKALAYSIKFAENDVTATKEQIEDFKKLAEAFDCELLEVTATYELKTLDGEEPGEEPEDLIEDIEGAKRKYIAGLLKGLLNDDEED